MSHSECKEKPVCGCHPRRLALSRTMLLLAWLSFLVFVIEPSPAHLSDVIKKIQEQDIRFLLMEPFYSRQAPDFVAGKTSIKVVQVAASVGGQPEATDYIHTFDAIVRACAATHQSSSPATKPE